MVTGGTTPDDYGLAFSRDMPWGRDDVACIRWGTAVKWNSKLFVVLLLIMPNPVSFDSPCRKSRVLLHG